MTNKETLDAIGNLLVASCATSNNVAVLRGKLAELSGKLDIHDPANAVVLGSIFRASDELKLVEAALDRMQSQIIYAAKSNNTGQTVQNGS